jgi:predicted Zn-dependent protease
LKTPTRAAVAGLMAAVIAGSAQPSLADPRTANLRPNITTDEGGLWATSDKAEQNARASGELDADPALTAYLKTMTCRLSVEYCDEIRLYVLDRPYLNASMAPNGYIEVWSGLLLRADDESQVAFVLGHEITHFAESHSLAEWRAAKSRANAAMIVTILSAGVGAGFLGNLAYLGAIASLMQFSREEETQADKLGFERVVKAGYDPQAAAALWRYLVDENAASDFDKTRKAMARGSLFASHPITADRIAALDGYAKYLPPAKTADHAAYRALIRPHLGAWLRDDLRRRDFGETLFLIDHLAKHGEDLGVLNYYRGEVFRQRRSEGDALKAQGAYEAAVQSADAPPATWRELGDLYAKAGDPAKAAVAYQGYLTHAPSAQDRWMVEASLKKTLAPAALAGAAPVDAAKQPKTTDTRATEAVGTTAAVPSPVQKTPS